MKVCATNICTGRSMHKRAGVEILRRASDAARSIEQRAEIPYTEDLAYGHVYIDTFAKLESDTSIDVRHAHALCAGHFHAAIVFILELVLFIVVLVVLALGYMHRAVCYNSLNCFTQEADHSVVKLLSRLLVGFEHILSRAAEYTLIRLAHFGQLMVPILCGLHSGNAAAQVIFGTVAGNKLTSGHRDPCQKAQRMASHPPIASSSGHFSCHARQLDASE